MSNGIDNPILNGPYDAPDRHYEIGPSGPTGVIVDGRRPSESFIPIAVTRKGKKGSDGPEQEGFDFDLTGERREKNSLINDIRRDVDKWRASGHYDGVTPITRKLLQHWADADRENRVIFAQREAAETAIFLTEVAGRHPSYADWRKRLEPENAIHNDGLPRAALKMATGAGKTIVMAMLIAWQTLNKAQSPNDARFTNRFLIVAPGITIRDRLNVLLPEAEGNYYDLRNLIPSDLKGGMESARIVITNFHAFQLKDAKEIKGVAKNTRLLLKGNKTDDPFKESPKAMVSRVLRGLGVTEAGKKQQIMVLNDEAHHCYLAKPLSSGKETSEEKNANEKAGLWFNGLRAIAKYVGIKQVFDLSATPFYLSGSGYAEGYIFPWVVSDFSLMDAIESGIVKVPRTPVDDDAETEHVVFLRLWEFIGKELPKRAPKAPVPGWMPKELEAALRSLHRSYEKAFSNWEQDLKQYGETPPVFIVVCPNTVVSKLVYTWIAGEEVVQDDEVIAHRPGELALLSNVVNGSPLPKPRTILIDSAQIESGEAMKADFKQAAGAEIAQFKAEYRKTNPGADVDKLTDEDLLREVMNTVGKPGKLGADIRCVVSVSMLTEGWDANTVTHILGVRAFKSQLLCEQVVGRGLRRRSYEVSEETSRFEPEYANVYGIPFQFVAGEPTGGEPAPPKPSIHVHAVEGREHLRINFPKLDGYRVEIPDEDIYPDLDQAPEFPIGKDTVPSWVELGGLVGKKELEEGDPTIYRTQEVAFRLAKRILDQHFTRAGDKRPWLFPKLVGICSEWIDRKVVVHEGYSLGFLVTITQAQILAAEQVWNAVIRLPGNRRERLRPMINRFDPEGSTGDVDFVTRKRTVPVEKSEVSHVTLDGNGPEGNSWEKRMAAILEEDSNVAAFVKNDQLGLTIPYVHKGRSHSYIPDFLVRLRRTGDDVERTLIIEISGSQKSPGPTNQKAETARNSWCVAVNNHGGWGRWAYIEMNDPDQFKTRLADAIQSLHGDKPIIGDPDLLDFEETNADTNTARSARGA